MKPLITALLALSALFLAVTEATQGQAAEPASLLLATTTSVQDSGLLDKLLPHFTEKTGISVRPIAVGTGAALRMGAEGNADVLLTHAPAAEQKLVDSGAVESRVEIMQNHFVLAGPEADPAGIRDAPDVLEALRRIQEKKAAFVSRGDDSGTHKREVALFKQAGLDPDEHWTALTRTGSGMGLSLQIAGQKGAYILSDIGTFLAFKKTSELVILSKPEDALRNVYSILRVSRERFPRVHSREAEALQKFFLSPATRKQIATFGVEKVGQPLFYPLDATSE